MMSELIRTFDEPGEFESLRAAEKWLKDRGFSLGTLQRGAPIGVMLGDCDISKWRNLDADERAEMHGVLTTASGSFREGAITFYIRDDVSEEVRSALAARLTRERTDHDDDRS